MPKYFTFLIDSDGRYSPKREFEAADDGAAVKSALGEVNGHSVELWGKDGPIGKFKHPHREWPARGRRG